ncbi:MAG: hypothetical protein Ct9H90mP22_3150 [Gammaproteobacteria bacterium]|nr:MAG: hypothetical protein Ct9H90mP22_3150 [Gammaproteobacteria bacterium]
MAGLQNLEDLFRSAKEGNKEIENFETSIFDGEYLDDKFLLIT